jgi:3-methylcrotonyl-CoA carboxylase alpha subunit
MDHADSMGPLMAGDAHVIEVAPGELIFERDGQRTRVFVAIDGNSRWVFVDGRTYQFEEVRGGSKGFEKVRRGSGGHGGSLSAPMPATVLRIQTSPGAVVKKGETLLVLEAMKMELPLRSPQDGTIEAVHCAEGQLVQPGVVLIDFKDSGV